MKELVLQKNKGKNIIIYSSLGQLMQSICLRPYVILDFKTCKLGTGKSKKLSHVRSFAHFEFSFAAKFSWYFIVSVLHIKLSCFYVGLLSMCKIHK